MSKAVPLPERLYRKAAEAARKERVSVEKFVTSALSEQLAAREYLQKRAARASRERFLAALDQVPDVEPAGADKP
jgi:hypothetical protein